MYFTPHAFKNIQQKQAVYYEIQHRHIYMTNLFFCARRSEKYSIRVYEYTNIHHPNRVHAHESKHKDKKKRLQGKQDRKYQPNLKGMILVL